MTAKVCPRCGNQYENFKSTTCPQCFAILVTVDEATASEMLAARAEVERSPEFQETKLADDERFRQQSFGACLTIIVLTVITLIVAVVLLVSAERHQAARSASKSAVSVVSAAKEEPLTTLPVAAAAPEEVLPPVITPYARQAVDAKTVLTGTLTPLFHGVYTRVPPAPNNGGAGFAEVSAGSSRPPPLLGRVRLLRAGGTLDVYALPAGRPTSEQNEFRLGITLASQVGGVSRPALFFATEYWHFAVLAAPGETGTPAAFRDALAAHFGYTGTTKPKGNR